MKRKPTLLKEQQFDVLIIGGGSHGACAARDAALRGMKVALIDKGDICGATSHNSLKTIHGGIRYLQHLNFKRVFESIKEQKIWLRTAPHLVKPLPFLMPTYGHGARGPFAMFVGVTLFRVLGWGRNRHLQANRQLSAGSVIGKAECINLAPNINTEKLSGGALWFDAQVEHADRAIMQIAEHADELGATICNYVCATELVFNNDTVIGAKVLDSITGDTFTISAKTVLNATGPWVSNLLRPHNKLATPVSLIKSMNLVTRLPAPKVAVAVQSKLASDSMIGASKRLYFVVPWLNKAVVGTTHFSFNDSPDALSVEHEEILSFIDEINQAYPTFNLTAEDVLYCYQGLTPEGDHHADDSPSNEHGHDSSKNAIQLHESKVIDHEKEHQIKGIVSIFSVKWTTARLVAKQSVDLIAKKINNSVKCTTAFEKITDKQQLPFKTVDLSENQLIAFCQSHIEHSMCCHLSDLLLRRTNDLVLGHMSFKEIQTVAHTMQRHFAWNTEQQELQLQTLLSHWLPNEIRKQLLSNPLWLN